MASPLGGVPRAKNGLGSSECSGNVPQMLKTAGRRGRASSGARKAGYGTVFRLSKRDLLLSLVTRMSGQLADLAGSAARIRRALFTCGQFTDRSGWVGRHIARRRAVRVA